MGELNIYTEVEEQLLQGAVPEEIAKKLCEKLPVERSYDLLQAALTGNYATVLQQPLFLELQHTEEIQKILSSNELDVLIVGISALQAFVQQNFTGPVDDETPADNSREEDLSKLDVSGEGVYPLLRKPQLLLLALRVLHESAHLWTCFKLAQWWQMRCVFVHQLVMENREPDLYKHLEKIMKELPICLSKRKLSTIFSLEAGYVCAYYYRISDSKHHFEEAEKHCGLSMKATGEMGKRTKFQQADIAQLVLYIERDSSICEDEGYSGTVPTDVRLNDEVRLEEIRLLSGEQKIPDLLPVEQATLLGSFFHLWKSQPKDELLHEELLPYLNAVLKYPKVWSIQTSALLARTKLEACGSRTVERAMQQCEVLVKNLSNPEPSFDVRTPYFYSVGMSPMWELERHLATLLESLGCIRSALDVYLRLQLWENVIYCYNTLQLRHKAEEVIREQLKKKETPKLYCLLGDATDNIEYYKKAWELSDHKSAMAQRRWGLYHYYRREYEEAIPHLQKSVELNNLQAPVWLRLAFCALKVENYSLCATGYHRYTVLDADNFEAWNNLSHAFIKMGHKERAWKALQEALRCSYENWKVWDNFMVVSVDLGKFGDAIKAYERILDLKEKHVDVEVLSVIAPNVPSSLKKKLLALFGRLTAQVPGNADLWLLYADLADDLAKKSQYLQKAQRNAVQVPGWEKESVSRKKVTDILHKFADVHMQYVFSLDIPPMQKTQQLSLAKFALNSAVTIIKKRQLDEPDASTDGLEIKLDEIVQKISDLQ